MKILKTILLGFLLVISMAFANALTLDVENQQIDEAQELKFPVIVDGESPITFAIETDIEGYEFNTETDSCIGQEDIDIITDYYYGAIDGSERYNENIDFNNDGAIEILDIAEITDRFEACKGDPIYNADYDVSTFVNYINEKDLDIMAYYYFNPSEYREDLDFDNDGEISVSDVEKVRNILTNNLDLYISQGGIYEEHEDYDARYDVSTFVASVDIIDQEDINIISRHYYENPTRYKKDLDFNNDGTIDILDIAYLTDIFGAIKGKDYDSKYDLSNKIRIFSWTPNFGDAGEQTIIFKVIDSEGNSYSKSIKIIVNDINTSPSKPSLPNPINNAEGVELNQQLSWQSTDVDGDDLIYEVYFGTNENPGLVSTQTTTTYNPILEYNKTYYWKIIVSDGKETVEGDSWKFTTKSESKLTIEDLDIKVGDKTDTNVLNGETLSKEAKPGHSVTLKFKIKNQFEEEIKIEDIDIKATLIAVDDGEDVEEESREFDLKQGKSKSTSITLDIPYKVEEGNYDLEIHIEGDDEDGILHQIDWTVKLIVEKDKHEVIIYKADLGNEVLSSVRTTNLNIELLNIGQEEEDNVKLVVLSEELGIDFIKQGIELTEEQFDDESGYEKTIRISLSKDFKEGTYPISIKVYRDNTLEDSKEVSLTIEEYTLKEEDKKGMEVITGKIIPKIKEIKEVEDIGVIAALIGGIFVVLVLIVLALYLGFRKR